MLTTTYGYLNPSSGDLSKGTAGWMAQLNFDITRLDGHSHNGIDSALLAPNAWSSVSTVAAAGSWLTNLGGAGLPVSGYYQTVTVPASVTEINNVMMKFLVNTAGSRQYQQLNLFFARLTGTTFNLYINDNTLDVLCVFR